MFMPTPIDSDNVRNIAIAEGEKETRLEDIQTQCSELISELDSNQNPIAVIKKHLSILEKYTDLKEIALGLVTMIADQRQLRTTDILEEMRLEVESNL